MTPGGGPPPTSHDFQAVVRFASRCTQGGIGAAATFKQPYGGRWMPAAI